MTANTKRVVFTMGGKGGVGKTGVMVALAEWFEENQIPVMLLDLHTENKARGSLQHFFNGRAPKSTSTRRPDSTPSSIISMAVRPSFLPIWDPRRAGCGRLVRVDVRRCRCNRGPLYSGWRGNAGPGQRRKRSCLGKSPSGTGGVRRCRERNQRPG